MKVQIFIEHDIIIRHFVKSNVLKALCDKHDVQWVFADYPNRIKSDVKELKLENYKIIPVDGKRTGKFRQLGKIRTIAISRGNEQFAFVKKQWKLFFGIKRYIKLSILSLPIIYNWYYKKVFEEAGKFIEMENVISEFKPDIILHPCVLEGVFITDVCTISKNKNIPTVVMMNSWDNPSTKAMVTSMPDWLVVWGEQTKQHSIDFLGFNPDRIKKFGAAQFDVYREPLRIDKHAYAKKVGIEAGNKIILYAGSSKSVNEMAHLKLLNDAVENGLLSNCKILYRPHPWRAVLKEEQDFFDIGFKHVKMDPSMIDSYKGSTRINLTDIRDTHDVLGNIDLLISNVSTILLEAGIHGKPSLCMVADEDTVDNDFLRITLESLYFIELLEKLDVPRCRDYKNLPDLCKDLLKKAELPTNADEIKKKSRFFIEFPDKCYGENISNLIESIV